MWKWHIHLSDSPDLRCAQNNRVEGYQSENRVQNKARWTQTKDFKAVRWFDQLLLSTKLQPTNNDDKERSFSSTRQMVDKKSDVGVRLEATFTDFNTNSSCKTKKRTLCICFGYERASGLLLVTCFLCRWNHDNGQLLWSKAKIYLWGTVPKIIFTTGEKRCPSIDEIMSVCFAARTTYAMETNRRYTE